MNRKKFTARSITSVVPKWGRGKGQSIAFSLVLLVLGTHTAFGQGAVKLQNENSRLFLAVSGADTNNGANVLQWTDNGQEDIKWIFLPSGCTRCKIRNLYTRKFLAIGGGSQRDGGNAIMWEDVGQHDIEWNREDLPGSDCFKLRNENSGKYLAVGGGSRERGANVLQWRDVGQRDLVWCAVNR